MAIKTFNIEEDVYKQFSGHCKENGISMSKQVEFFMRSVIEKEPTVRKEYLEKLDRIRREGKFIRVDDFGKHFNLSPRNRR